MDRHSGYSARAFGELEAYDYDDEGYFDDWKPAAPEDAPVPFSLKADRETTPTTPTQGRDGRMHAVAAGYDGEGEGPRGGVYGWDCDCGTSRSDYGDEDSARLGASGHLAEVEIPAEVA